MTILPRLFTFVRPYWWATGGALVLMVIGTGLRMAPAWFTKEIIDHAIPARDSGLIGIYVGLFIAAAFAYNAMSAIETYLQQFVGQRVIFDLRNALYGHLQSQSMSFYDANQTGQLMSRVTNDVSQVQFFLTQGVSRLVSTIATVVIYFVVLVALDAQLTAVTLIVAPGIWALQDRLKDVMPLMRRVQSRMADLNVVIQEFVAGVKMIQAFGRESHEARRFDEVNLDIRTNRNQQQRMMAVVMPGQEFLTNLSLVLVLVVGAWRVMDGSMSLGTLVAFQAYVLTMWTPVRWIGMINQMAQQAIAAGERVFEIIDTALDVTERPDAIDLPVMRGAVQFEHVSFAYGRGKPLLQDIDFVAEPGKTVAIVGPSGSGKTTIVNLIPRFYDATRGRVLIDGIDVCDVTLSSLRAQVGIVLQETFLFNMTVRENIRYGRSTATDAEVEHAARFAHAHEFIVELPEGYDTLCGERGARMSGGQRQRIAIARALLVDPRILILDEATSSVDTRTDFLIQGALDQLMRNRTTLVIAHRVSTIQRADLILVIAEGRIIDRGTHADLIRRSGPYAFLYETQMLAQESARRELSGLAAS
ncbi:MAG: ABC transporter ATP-binding protein [Chloroflexota bacterium]|nr:MAG: ABC transporter ATP-binding protein [Chloroflexota bacterium]